MWSRAPTPKADTRRLRGRMLKLLPTLCAVFIVRQPPAFVAAASGGGAAEKTAKAAAATGGAKQGAKAAAAGAKQQQRLRRRRGGSAAGKGRGCLTTDGVHLNQAGNILVATEAALAIRRAALAREGASR